MVKKGVDGGCVLARDTKQGFGRLIHGYRGEGGVENHDSVGQAVDNFLPETRRDRGGLAHGDGDQITRYHKASNGLRRGSMDKKDTYLANILRSRH